MSLHIHLNFSFLKFNLRLKLKKNKENKIHSFIESIKLFHQQQQQHLNIIICCFDSILSSSLSFISTNKNAGHFLSSTNQNWRKKNWMNKWMWIVCKFTYALCMVYAIDLFISLLSSLCVCVWLCINLNKISIIFITNSVCLSVYVVLFAISTWSVLK